MDNPYKCVKWANICAKERKITNHCLQRCAQMLEQKCWWACVWSCWWNSIRYPSKWPYTNVNEELEEFMEGQLDLLWDTVSAILRVSYNQGKISPNILYTLRMGIDPKSNRPGVSHLLKSCLCSEVNSPLSILTKKQSKLSSPFPWWSLCYHSNTAHKFNNFFKSRKICLPTGNGRSNIKKEKESQ